LEKPGAAKLATFSGSNKFQRYSVFSFAARLREMAFKDKKNQRLTFLSRTAPKLFIPSGL